ncbi:M6 family metalloprotease domain-containing protein [Streptomyces triticirhizae]|uniref:M6 family metalloprotease domain-containing protein n=1 Tax=Streptomyces triticirhizae TaxID=2483353 RepID=A0A3M2LJD4_9ACTN|nr:immune inhibitor A domain-containing protein [Streptomyces triticirhizae]RMI37564.1 M6 family metalloprotease domain-containing protein [Streptomyces triticirhizae]
MKLGKRSTRSTTAAVATAIAALGAAALVPVGTAQAQQPPADEGAVPQDQRFSAAEPELENPLAEKREAQRQQAFQRLIAGESSPRTLGGSEVVELSEGEFVEVATTGTDKIFTVLVEFGDEIHPDYGGTPGPRVNEIAEPDREVDNSTIWQEDFDREYYEDIYYSEDPEVPSVKQYFERQSSGQYTVDGLVTDWVRVDYNEARYGTNACGDNVCDEVWNVVTDGVNAWYEDQIAAGVSPDEIAATLAEYDVQDRYDYDGDGDFNEPDGYLDHFQIVHAGEDESAGGGAQGEDAIWAHRWYAFADQIGTTGPEYNPAGGTQVADTGLWVGDYTIQPENGGVGVFAHEFAHDLGLPDLYDTAGGENGTAFWSAMSSGSWLSLGEGAIGTLPNDMGSWEKLQLGWLDYEVTRAASTSLHLIGPSSEVYPQRGNTQAVIVELPEKTVTHEIAEPAEGEAQWWSGSGDDLSNTLTRTVDLTGASTASLDLTGWWNIEEGYDNLYVEASTGGAWTPLEGTVDGEPLPQDSAGRSVVTGVSDGHRALSYPLDAYAGSSVDIRFRYQTDGGLAEIGFTADEITVTADGEVVFSDNAEEGEGDWEADGFSVVGASVTDDYPQYYIVENRQYVGYDATLERGPYNFGWLTERPDWVEHYSYENGMLVWLWDTSQSNNNTSQHPGEGLILPVDAHPTSESWSDGTTIRNRIQSRDATFGRSDTAELTLHLNGEPTTLPSQDAVRAFDDRRGEYWDESNPGNSVIVPDTNTRISVLAEPRRGTQPLVVLVSPSGR